MSVLVVGTVGIDTVETPKDKKENILGGSAVYFSYAASFYTPVHLVGVVGNDFPEEHKTLLLDRGVDLSGLEVADGETFRWVGRYHENMIDRDTLQVDLNVFGSFDPKVPEASKDLDFVFLANGSPSVQRKVLQQMTRRPQLVAADTMDLWIETARPELESLLKEIDILVLNDSEARLMTDEQELLLAGRKILELGPKTVVIKKGEHGALTVNKDFGPFAIPGYPLEEVIDPTGAGDTFAGALMGYLAEAGTVSQEAFRRAVAHGAVVASYTVQGFSLDALKTIDRAAVNERYEALMDIVRVG